MSSGRIKSYKTLNSETDELNQVQGRLKQIFEPLLRSEIINGVLLKNIELKSGVSNMVSHKLNREIQGYILIDQNASALIYRVVTKASIKTQYIDLRTNQDVKISIWIF